MKRFATFAIGLSALAATQSAWAMESVAWDLRGAVPEGLSPQNLTTVELSESGLYVATSADGFLELPALTGPADVLVLTVTNIASPEAALIWRTADLPENQYYQKNVVLPVGQSKEAYVRLNEIPDWEWSSPTLALAFPAGTELLVERMEWRRYSAAEKAWNGILSFWTPDEFTLYSINFLWGPLIGVTPESRATLYESLPPTAWSATRIFYGILALAAIGAGLWWKAKPEGGRRRFLATLAVVGAALWIVFDLRMTQEIFRYVRDDWATYVTQPAGTRTLRTHATLYDALDALDSMIADDERYVLLAKEGTPFFANVRYKLYPAVPLRETDPRDGATAWIVLGRDDVRAQTGALVAADGSVLARGSVVHRFDDTSYVFRPAP